MGTIANNDNLYGVAALIVDATAGKGNFTTIQAAITAASSGQTIFIRPGTYTENLTLKAGVNLTAFIGDELTPNVTIIGKATFTAAGTVSISGIRLQTNSDFFLAVTGSANSIVNFIDCYFNCTNNTGISFTTSGTSSLISCFNCLGDIGTTGISLFASSAAGDIKFYYTQITNSGSSTTASTVSVGNIFFRYCNMAFPVSSSGTTSSFQFMYSVIDSAGINTTSITHNSTQATGCTIDYCALDSGSASAISIGAGAKATLRTCKMTSSNTNVATGSGTLDYADLLFAGSSSGMNVTTKTALTQGTGSLKFFTASGTTGSAVSNTMTVYEEGTWTPTLDGAVSGTTTYTIQQGYYTKIGNLVWITATIGLTAATGTGNAQIGGLPFTVKNQTNGATKGIVNLSSTAWAWPASTTTMTLALTANATTATIGCTGSTVANASLQMTNGAATFVITATYQV
jgi:hypothetical protein